MVHHGPSPCLRPWSRYLQAFIIFKPFSCSGVFKAGVLYHQNGKVIGSTFFCEFFLEFFIVRVLFLSTSLFLLFGFFDFAVFLHVSLLLWFSDSLSFCFRLSASCPLLACLHLYCFSLFPFFGFSCSYLPLLVLPLLQAAWHLSACVFSVLCRSLFLFKHTPTKSQSDRPLKKSLNIPWTYPNNTLNKPIQKTLNRP